VRVDSFDFELPPERIALRPASPRDSARLLVVGADATLRHAQVSDLPDTLQRGDVLVVNDTRVIPGRLAGTRLRTAGPGSQAKIEVTLHKRVDAATYRAFARPAKRLQADDVITFRGGLTARVVARESAEVELEFDRRGPDLDAALAEAGDMPLPPYIAGKRKPDASDLADYQTLFAEHSGAVAAPTAGLHFTPALMGRLAAAGIGSERITLHVGAGTFLPVTAETTEEHRMHGEWARLSSDVAARLNRVRSAGGRIVAVGSTALRTLESAADEDGTLHAFEGDTALFITPGYRFKAVDAMLTNFHLPRSTLFMLVCAFSGSDVMKRAYSAAIASEYRFYSYGDACLLFRPDERHAI
jgi:S-adenosylmethionine:tRNA ribosyltransferase-isomerase